LKEIVFDSTMKDSTVKYLASYPEQKQSVVTA